MSKQQAELDLNLAVFAGTRRFRAPALKCKNFILINTTLVYKNFIYMITQINLT